MTEIDEEEGQVAEFETAGSLLKAAREEVEMTLEEAAERLHLLKETVIALEEDDASSLPSRVFTLGYLKNYARILDLPEWRIMELLKDDATEVEGIRNLQQPRTPQIRIRQRGRDGHLLIKAITWLIVIVIIASLVLWWRGVIQLPDLSGVSFFSTTDKQESVEASGDDGSEMLILPISDKQTSENEAQQDVTAVPDNAAKTSGDETTAEAKGGEEISADAGETSGETSGETLTASGTLEKTAVSDDVVVIATDSAGEKQAGGQHKITLDFSDNCWVNVNDAGGKIVLSGDIAAGSSKTLEGKAPFTFVLGNATNVKVSIDGRAYDIAPHIKGGVARFSLGEPVE